MRPMAISAIVVLFVATTTLWAGGQTELSGEPNVTIDVDGMYCNLCAKAVRKSLLQVEGVAEVVVSLDEGKAWLIVVGSVSDDDLAEAVRRAGADEYTATRIDRNAGAES